MKTLNEMAESYFNTLNPIAERISTDIIAIKDAYEGLWNCLSTKEKNQIINETVVHPEAVLKYTLGSNDCKGIDLDIPLISPQVTGSKYIVDESTGLSWRDEHSAPFSWKSPSQIDLSIFTSSNAETETKTDNTFYLNNRNKVNQNFYASTRVDGKIEQENNRSKIISSEKKDSKKTITSLQSPNVVLVGTCSKLSGLCSKLKFLPGKSFSYEVQTVVSNPTDSNEGSFLEKIKASAYSKFQNTLKLVGGKNSNDKKSADGKEIENLVSGKPSVTVVRLQKPSPKIAKPKSPPPPPPKKNEEEDNKSSKNLIHVKNTKNDKSHDETDSERVTLLEETSVQSFLSADPDSFEQELKTRVAHELSDDINSISTECTPLSGPSVDVIPKSGFDFLDNCYRTISDEILEKVKQKSVLMKWYVHVTHKNVLVAQNDIKDWKKWLVVLEKRQKEF